MKALIAALLALVLCGCAPSRAPEHDIMHDLLSATETAPDKSEQIALGEIQGDQYFLDAGNIKFDGKYLSAWIFTHNKSLEKSVKDYGDTAIIIDLDCIHATFAVTDAILISTKGVSLQLIHLKESQYKFFPVPYSGVMYNLDRMICQLQV